MPSPRSAVAATHALALTIACALTCALIWALAFGPSNPDVPEGPPDGLFEVEAHASAEGGAVGLPDSSSSPPQRVAATPAARETAEVRSQPANPSTPVPFRAGDVLRGRVVDLRGASLAGAAIAAVPQSASEAKHTTSDTDGRFVLAVPRPEPYMISVRCAGYRAWGGTPDTSYVPGAHDIEVVLAPLPTVRFRVVDDRTGAPLERCGVAVWPEVTVATLGTGLEAFPLPLIGARPGGIVELGAEPGVDRWVAAADDYCTSEGLVASGSGARLEQTLRLRRTAVVKGRVLRDGEPLAGMTVELTQRRARNESAEVPNGQRHTEPGLRLKLHPPRPLIARTGEDGRFTLSVASEGEWRLAADAGQDVELTRDGIEILGGDVLDLGDLAAVQLGAVEGTVLVPPGVSFAGLAVHLDLGKKAAQRTAVDDSGRFRFDGVPTGRHRVSIEAPPETLAPAPSVFFGVEPGVTTRVEVDVSAFATCRVSATVRGVEGRAGAHFTLVPVWQEPELRPIDRIALGDLDARGRVDGHMRAAGHVTFELVEDTEGRGSNSSAGSSVLQPPPSPHRCLIAFPGTVVNLGAAPHHHVDLDVALGSLTLALTGPLVVEAGARARIDVTVLEPQGQTQSFRPGPPAAERRIELPHVLAGRVRVTVRIVSRHGKMVRNEEGRMTYDERTLSGAVGEVVVPPGGHATLDLALSQGE